MNYHATTTGSDRGERYYNPIQFVEYDYHRNDRQRKDYEGNDTYHTSRGNERRKEPFITDYGIDDPSEDTSDEKYVRLTRSPVKRLARSRIEVDAPKHNFGDYDPVRPSGFSGRGSGLNLSEKAQNRRIIFKGISEEEVWQQRRKRQINSVEEPSWQQALSNTNDDQNLQKYAKSTVQDYPHPSSADSHRGDYGTEQSSSKSIYCSNYNKTRLVSGERNAEIRDVNFEGDSRIQDFGSGSPAQKDYYQYSQSSILKAFAFAQNYNNLEDISPEEHTKMFGKKWYEVDESELLSTGEENDEEEQEYLRSEKVFEEWKQSADGKKYLALSRTIQNPTHSVLTPSGSFGGFPRSSSLNSVHVHSGGESSSTWEKMSRGTGFFQGESATGISAGNSRQRQSNECAAGYQSKDGSLYHTSPEVGKSERLFKERIYELDYFFNLKARPTEMKQGTRVFSYELEFWPVQDANRKDVVFGYQMEDKELARDSVFVAGLAKLQNAKRIVDNSYALQILGLSKNKEKSTPISTGSTIEEKSRNYYQSNSNTQTTSQSLLESFRRPASTSRAEVPSSQMGYQSRSFETSSLQNTPNPSKSIESVPRSRSSLESPDEYRRTSLNSSHVKERGTTERDPASSKLVPKASKEGRADGFKFAIPRAPSMIDEQFRNKLDPYPEKRGFGGRRYK